MSMNITLAIFQNSQEDVAIQEVIVAKAAEDAVEAKASVEAIWEATQEAEVDVEEVTNSMNTLNLKLNKSPNKITILERKALTHTRAKYVMNQAT